MATLNGDDGNNRLVAGPEDDIIFGHGGNDELHGLEAHDTLYGGDGADLLFGGADGNDSLYGGAGNDQIHGVWETDKVWGGDGDDTLFGGKTGADVLYGDGGNDRIYAGGCRDLSIVNTAYGGDGRDHVGGDCGTDYLYGDLGEDLVWGGHGDDFCWGGAGSDVVAGNHGEDVLYGGARSDRLIGAQHDDIGYGEAGRDKVYGNGGDDTLSGGGGNEFLTGGVGNDILLPGAGRDKVAGGGGRDTVSYADLSGGTGVLVHIPNDRYGKAARGDDVNNVENVIGSPYRDTLTPSKGGTAFGGAGNDVIKSDSGAVMRGDAGVDKLIGDAKKKFADVFWLQSPGSGPEDIILKFDAGQDKLRTVGSDLRIGKSLTGDELVNLASGHEGSGAGPQLIYEKSSKTLWYDADGGGSGGAVKVAKFTSGPASLGVDDFDMI